jgi:hypothetical protein
MPFVGKTYPETAALTALLRCELGLKVYSQPDLAKFTLYSHYSYDQDRTKWDRRRRRRTFPESRGVLLAGKSACVAANTDQWRRRRLTWRPLHCLPRLASHSIAPCNVFCTNFDRSVSFWEPGGQWLESVICCEWRSPWRPVAAKSCTPAPAGPPVRLAGRGSCQLRCAPMDPALETGQGTGCARVGVQATT